MRRCLLVALALVPVAGCGAEDFSTSASSAPAERPIGTELRILERDIKADLQRQYRADPLVKDVIVRSVDCVKKTDQEARCFAKLRAENGYSPASIGIQVTYDQSGEGYLWETDAF